MKMSQCEMLSPETVAEKAFSVRTLEFKMPTHLKVPPVIVVVPKCFDHY